MPIYEYRCVTCGTTFEKLTLGAEAGGICCPGCKGEKVEKIFSRFASVKLSRQGCDGPQSPACGSGCCNGCGM